ncbi:MAG: alpha/beta fold hydrolase [Chloroflexi bacterium]|nr:alpha/beta fold hydrolase [Chloroflexota bacterium]
MDIVHSFYTISNYTISNYLSTLRFMLTRVWGHGIVRPMPYLLTNAIQTYYEEAGQGTPLVLIHDLGSSHGFWDLQVPEFAAHFRVITYDIRGHGKSEKVDRFRFEDTAEDLQALLNALEAVPAHVVGVGFGGLVSQTFTLRHQELVRRLVLLETYCKTPGGLPGMGLRLQTLNLFLLRLLGPLGSILYGWIVSLILAPPLSAGSRTLLYRELAHADLSQMAKASLAALDYTEIKQLARILVKTLVLAGFRNAATVQQARLIARSIPTSTLQFLPRGVPPSNLTVSELFNRVVIDFLEADLGVPGR